MSNHHLLFHPGLAPGHKCISIKRNTVFIKRLLSGVILLFQIPLLQAQEKTEVKELFFPVDIVSGNGDSVHTIIKNAGDINIEDGAFVKAWQRYKAATADNPERSSHTVGSGTAVIRGDNKIVAIKLFGDSGSFKQGDLISVRVKIPALPYRSIFSELAFQNIIFKKRSGERLYDLVNLLYHDSKRLEDSIYSEILADSKVFYDYAKNLVNLSQIWLKPIEAGRLKGKILLETAGRPARNDLDFFYLYVKDYPAKYIGDQNLNVNQSFAGWLLVNAPYGHSEVKKALLPLQNNKPVFNSKLSIYKKSILDENQVREFDDQADELLKEYKFNEAETLAAFALNVAGLINDTANLPHAHLTMAGVYERTDQYVKCIGESDKSLAGSIRSGNKSAELLPMIKKAYSLFKISKFSESQALFDTTASKLHKYRPHIEESFFL